MNKFDKVGESEALSKIRLVLRSYKNGIKHIYYKKIECRTVVCSGPH